MTKTRTNDVLGTAVMSLPVSKSQHVRGVFEDVSRYVNRRQLDIQVRRDTVKAWARDLSWRDLLDIGCGDGSISLPLLTGDSHLTMLDLSENMLRTVQAKVPNPLSANVQVRNENFMAADFNASSFDLVVCVGVLAHVDSPEEFIGKIARVLRPGGSLILAFTDTRHATGRFADFLGSLKELAAPARYPVNDISFSDVAEMFKRNKMKLVSTYRYAQVPIPGVNRLISAGALHKIVTGVFGRCDHNRNAWLGNEYICLLTV
jgi:ubiquinone/menaquinone biosynthesis C-methylase UbiE